MSGLAWAAADMAIRPATVRARTRVSFIGGSEAQGAREVMLPSSVTARYNFRVINT